MTVIFFLRLKGFQCTSATQIRGTTGEDETSISCLGKEIKEAPSQCTRQRPGESLTTWLCHVQRPGEEQAFEHGYLFFCSAPTSGWHVSGRVGSSTRKIFLVCTSQGTPKEAWMRMDFFRDVIVGLTGGNCTLSIQPQKLPCSKKRNHLRPGRFRSLLCSMHPLSPCELPSETNRLFS